MALSKENLSFFLVSFWMILLILVPYSHQILQDDGSHPILPSAIEDQEDPNPGKFRDDSHAQRLKISSQQKPEKPVAAGETQRDQVLERYHERDEMVADGDQDDAQHLVAADISDSDQDGVQRGRGGDQGVGDTYMTVVGDGDDLEIVTVTSPVINNLNSLHNVDEGGGGFETKIKKNLESYRNRKARNRNHLEQKHRNKIKNHEQLLHTKELLLHPHSIQMKDALEHFKSVMQRLGNMTDLFQRFLPSREVSKKTHSFIKKLRKLKKVSHNKGKGSRLKRHARPHPLPLSHHSVQYLKALGFTQDDLRFYGLKDNDIFHPAGSGKDEVLTFKGTVTEELNKLKKSTAETLRRAERASDLRRSKRSVSKILSRSKRSIPKNLPRLKRLISENLARLRDKRSIAENLIARSKRSNPELVFRYERDDSNFVGEKTESGPSIPIKSEPVVKAKKVSESVKSVDSVKEEANPDVEHVQFKAKIRDGEVFISEKVSTQETSDLKSTGTEVPSSHAPVVTVSKVKTSTTNHASVLENTKISSKGVKNDKDAKLGEPEVIASPLPVVNPTTVVLENVDMKESPPKAIAAEKSPSADVQLTSASVPLAPQEDEVKDEAANVKSKRDEDPSIKVIEKDPVGKTVKTDNDISTTSEKAAKVTETSGDKVVAKNIKNSRSSIDTGEVDSEIGSPSAKIDSLIPTEPSKMALKSGSTKDTASPIAIKPVIKLAVISESSSEKVDSKVPENSPEYPIDSSTTEESSPSSVDSRKTALKSPIPVDPAVVVPINMVADATEGDAVDATDCSDASMWNDTECAAEVRNSNYIVNIAFIRNSMNDRSKDALYGILSLGLLVGTVLLAVLYTQMWRTKREGWFTSKDHHHENSPHVKIGDVLKSKARYLPMFHKKWKTGKKYEALKQEDMSESSEDEIYDQRRLMQVNSYED